MVNFLLVHGGMTGGWSWKKVRHCLEKKNHCVLTPTLTGLGDRKHLTNRSIDLEVHINDIINTVFYEDWKDVVLVGHSYGGMVVDGVADQIPHKIKRLIYVDAVLAKDGESLFDAIDPAVAAYLLNRALEKGEGWEIPPGNSGDSEWFDPRCSPHPLKSFQQPLRLKGHSKHGKIYIKCTQDHALDSMVVRVKEMGIPCQFIDAGHFPMVTHPQELTDLLLQP
jgi:pimeloyl-ACP methyl ester carboxylesterase